MHLLARKSLYFYWNFTEIWSWGFNWFEVNIGSGNGFMPSISHSCMGEVLHKFLPVKDCHSNCVGWWKVFPLSFRNRTFSTSIAAQYVEEEDCTALGMWPDSHAQALGRGQVDWNVSINCDLNLCLSGNKPWISDTPIILGLVWDKFCCTSRVYWLSNDMLETKQYMYFEQFYGIYRLLQILI